MRWNNTKTIICICICIIRFYINIKLLFIFSHAIILMFVYIHSEKMGRPGKRTIASTLQTSKYADSVPQQPQGEEIPNRSKQESQIV